MADPRRIVQARSQLHMGLLVLYWGRGTCKLRGARVAATKDRQITLLDEQSKQRFSVLYAAVVPMDEQHGGTSPFTVMAGHGASPSLCSSTSSTSPPDGQRWPRVDYHISS